MRDSSADLRERLVQYMRKNKLKHTRQRQAIVDAFLGMSGHTSIDSLLVEVQKIRPSVGYATVYRSLKMFVAAGVASERRFGDGPSLFEPVEQGSHHDHLICVLCKRIFEFEDQIIEEQQLVVAKKMGLKLTSHRMTLFGECIDKESCKANRPPSR